MKNKKSIRGLIILLLAAFVWGMAFVAQKVGTDIAPFTFTFLRSLIGSVSLIVVFLVNDKIKKKKPTKEERKKVWKGGFFCGILLFSAINFQQFGLSSTTASKAGFITTMYIVLVPIIGLFFHHKINFLGWISVIVAMAGLYLLSIKGSFQISTGDALMMVCAVLFSCHILCVGRFTNGVDAIRLCFVQTFVCGILSFIGMLIFELDSFSWNVVFSNKVIIAYCYAGIFSSGVGYTLQIIGQRYCKPSIASLAMCFESVFAALGGMIILHENLSLRETFGCILLFVAIIMAQIEIPEKKRKEIECEKIE